MNKRIKLWFDPYKANVIWSNDNYRVIRTANNKLIVEEKYFSLMYSQDYWVDIPNPTQKAKILEETLKNVFSKMLAG